MKKHRKEAPATTPGQVKAIADAMTRKVAAMFIEFYRRTGHAVGIVEVLSNGAVVDGKIALSQTVNIRYGTPEPARPKVQIARPA